jgi:hypothetical protein
VREQDLETAGRPAKLLLGVVLDRLRRIADRQHVGDVDTAPAALVQHQRRPHVLRLGVGVDSADVVHRGSPEHHVGTHTEGSVEVIASGLDEAVEDGLHVARAARHEVPEVAVTLRGLHEGDGRIGEEGHGLNQELRPGHEIRVENAEVVGLDLAERVIHVARLRSAAAQPPQIPDPELGREVADLVAPAVVEDPRRVASADVPCSAGGTPDHVQRFAVTRDQDGDGDLLSVEQEWCVLLGPVVEERLPGSEVGVVAGALRTGKDRPHRQQGMGDQDRLGTDHQTVGQGVTPVGRVEQEDRVEDDAAGRNEREQDHHRRVGIPDQLPAGQFIRTGDRFQIMGWHFDPWSRDAAGMPREASRGIAEKAKPAREKAPVRHWSWSGCVPSIGFHRRQAPTPIANPGVGDLRHAPENSQCH